MSHGDRDELRAYLDRFAEECADRNVAFTAETQSILTLRDEDRFEECIAAFEARRNRVETLADSIRNEKQVIFANLAVNAGNRVASNRRSHGVAEIESKMAELNALLQNGGDRRSANVLPSTFRLSSIYPNPFNSQTVISFDLDKAGTVEVGVYDLAGKEIAKVGKGEFEPGSHKLMWNATAVPTGIYFVKFTTPGGVCSSRVALVR